jgi:hypothetical protein
VKLLTCAQFLRSGEVIIPGGPVCRQRTGVPPDL